MYADHMGYWILWTCQRSPIMFISTKPHYSQKKLLAVYVV